MISSLLSLAAGSILNVAAQFVTDTKFADPSSQIIPWIKFTSSLIFAYVASTVGRPSQAAGKQSNKTATAYQKNLMTLIGILDMTAYTTFTLGFVYCGAALSSVLLSSVAQVFTAFATRFVLRKKLSRGQIAAIVCVCGGLAIRAAPAEYFDSWKPATSLFKTLKIPTSIASSTKLTAQSKGTTDLVKGSALIILSAFLYSALGVTYETLVNTSNPPQYPEVLWNISKLGFLISTTYQCVYTLPRWDKLVGQYIAKSPASVPHILVLLASFGAMFNVHMFVQSLVFRSEGALGVGLVNAVRGAVVTVITGVLFCSDARPWLCMTPQSMATVVVTTAGGVAWVLSKPPAVQKRPNTRSRSKAKKN